MREEFHNSSLLLFVSFHYFKILIFCVSIRCFRGIYSSFRPTRLFPDEFGPSFIKGLKRERGGVAFQIVDLLLSTLFSAEAVIEVN